MTYATVARNDSIANNGNEWTIGKHWVGFSRLS